jgi:hypothetical protein
MAVMLGAFGGVSLVTAQEASPEASPTSLLAGAGLPELAISVSPAGYEGVPDEVAAGRYLIRLSVPEDMEDGGIVAFAQPPEGMSADEFLAVLSGPPDETGAGAAGGTPIVDAVTSPVASPEGGAEGMGGPPEALYQAQFAGGVSAPPGASAEVVLDLGPGEWIAWAEDPGSIEPVVFEVTGEMPAELPEPEASATIIMAEYLIEVSEGALVAGPQVVRIDNIGAQPHFIGWFLGPDGMTPEQVETALNEEAQAEMTGTPVAYSGLDPNQDLMPVTFTANQSTGTSMWIQLDLSAGKHLVACFFPDISDGIPHAFHGMFNVIEVPQQ